MTEEKDIDSSFVKVKCEDCGNEQITFRKASSVVDCNVCGGLLVEPTGGIADFKGEVEGIEEGE